MLAPQTIRPRIRPGVVLLVGVAVLVLLFMAALGIGWLAAKQRVRAELARIRAAGEPISPEDLDAFYQKPPSDRDTTQLWLDAIAALESFRTDERDLRVRMLADLPPPGELWPEHAAAEAMLIKYREPLDKMHRAADLGGIARYTTDFSVGAPGSPPWLELRSGVQLLIFESEVRARNHEPSAVAESIGTMFAAANSISDEPTVSAQLIRLALDGMARFELERQLSSARVSENDLERIDRQLADADYRASFRRAMLGARATGMEYFVDPAALGGQTPTAMSAIFRPSDQMVYLILWRS